MSTASGSSRPLAVDLYAGTAGATAAFRSHGWDVVAVDLVAAAFRGEAEPAPGGRSAAPGNLWRVVADCRALPLPVELPRRPAFVWASPPCTDFSIANPRRPERPSLDLVFAALRAVRDWRPRFWILENVTGLIPFLGVPTQKVGPWCLWGYFPLIEPTFRAQTYRKAEARQTPRDRAAVPYELSEDVYTAVSRGRGLHSLLDMRPFRRHRHVAGRRRPPEPDLWERRLDP